MAWEKRNRNGCYFYAGKKVQGTVRKEYLGCGIAAALIADRLLKQKTTRQTLWQKRRALFQSLRTIHHHIRAFQRFSCQLERLLQFSDKETSDGVFMNPSLEAEYSCPMTKRPEEPQMLPMLPAIDSILRHAKHGDVQGLAQVDQMLAQKPQLWQRMIDLARQAQETQLNVLAGENLRLKAAVLAQLKTLKKALGDGTANALEQILIERIVISWLQAQHTDLLLAKTPVGDTRLTKLLQKRADQSQGRLQRAITQLETMRRPRSPKGRKKSRLSAAVGATEA